MDEKGKIRMATADDSDEVLDIYAYYVENTSISFEYEVPSSGEFRFRMGNIMKQYPWLVYEENGEILGYAYASPEYTRAAYMWTCESSVYVKKGHERKGIGAKLYQALFRVLAAQNYRVCYAIVIAENEPSMKFHEEYGFRIIGHNESTGYKLGAWHGTYKLEKILNRRKNPPDPIIPVTGINTEEYLVIPEENLEEE